MGKTSKYLFIISLFHFVNDAAVVTLPIVYPILYDKGFIITRYSYIGILFLTGLVVTVLIQSLIGNFARPRHFGKILPAAVLLLAFSLLSITHTNRFITFMFIFLLIRTSTSFYHPIGIAWINTLSRGKQLDHSMGMQSAMGDLGVFVSFLIGGILAERMGWRFPVLTWACVALVVSVFGFISIGRSSSTSIITPDPDSGRSWKDAFRSTKPLIPALLLGGTTWVTVIGFAPSLFHHRMMVSMTNTGYILAFWIGMGTISSILYGRIVPYFGHRTLLIISYTIVSLSSLILWQTQNTALAVGVMGIFGFFLFLSYPCLLSYAGKQISDASAPGAFSIIANLQMIGGAAFSFVAGFLSDSYGIATPFLLLTSLSLLVIIYLLFPGRRLIRSI